MRISSLELFLVEHPQGLNTLKLQTRYEKCYRKSQKSKIRNNGKLIHYQIGCLEWFPKIFGNDSKRSCMIIPHSGLVGKSWLSNWKVGQSYIEKSYLNWKIPSEVGQLFQLRLVLFNSKKVSNLSPYNIKLSNLSIFQLLFPSAPYEIAMWHYCQYDYHTLNESGLRK